MIAITTVLAGMTLMAAPLQGPSQYEKDLLPVGAQMHDYTLLTPGGEKVKLSEVFKKHKVTIVNFFFVH
ncbi:MAG: hypothetical protein IH851_06580 [Armatimonadetes bacterium]|nr:hypothetical protein [Armatimonadota bacterium]